MRARQRPRVNKTMVDAVMDKCKIVSSGLPSKNPNFSVHALRHRCPLCGGEMYAFSVDLKYDRTLGYACVSVSCRHLIYFTKQKGTRHAA